MSTLEVAGPNAEQIEYWNEVSGPKWVAFEALLDAQISPLGLAAMERAQVAPGERALDVGCGCGQTSLQLGERVGAGGAVTGIDLSLPMLERARRRAAESGATHVRFEQADAQLHAFEQESFDLVFSRFGVMFFADPTAAFANLASGLRPGARLAFVCWQGLDRNEWLRLPLLAAAPHMELPPPPPPDAPGPLAFADPQRVRRILGGAGFADVDVAPLEGTLVVGGGGSLERSVDFVLNLGPLGRALREADAALRERVAGAVREAALPYASDAGVRMGFGAWIVTARI